MKSLFIDTTNNKIVLAYLVDDVLKDSIIVEAKNKISDVIDITLKQFLDKQNVRLNELTTFYVTKGPGTFTGVRIGLSIVKTIWTINKDIKVYSINTMQLMAGIKQTAVAIDARGNKHFFANLSNGEFVDEIALLQDDKLPTTNIVKNTDSINYVKNFEEVKKNFILEKDITNFNPIYIKKAI
ncbi:tRNA (adenosine(37)-N6)-threonylcarbamoyltransferase complex dimerization subunit type 1 TsaB [Spiroplasma endosymbiont of Othius punctulatus]|uniref:tRNA (adenosine(37)-N6)-threonylcarbamoyltransferase complex dimerization subunit type 1 TsaB n=1 Tax=Spiroplasma endosymbiont of Othius punctulatus TaxID=3066289 RepID=UPI0030D09CD9